jgi:hypothetical protein
LLSKVLHATTVSPSLTEPFATFQLPSSDGRTAGNHVAALARVWCSHGYRNVVGVKRALFRRTFLQEDQADLLVNSFLAKRSMAKPLIEPNVGFALVPREQLESPGSRKQCLDPPQQFGANPSTLVIGYA